MYTNCLEFKREQAETHYMSFNIPNKKYKSDETTVISIRVPVKLKDEVLRIAKKKGYTASKLIEALLEQYCQQEETSPVRKGK